MHIESPIGIASLNSKDDIDVPRSKNSIFRFNSNSQERIV